MDIGEFVANDYQDVARHRVSAGHVVTSLPIEIIVGTCIALDFLIPALTVFCAHPFSDGTLALRTADAASAVLLGFIYALSCQQRKLYDIRTLRDGLRCFSRLLARWSMLCVLLLAAMAIAGTADRSQCYYLLFYSAAGFLGLCVTRAFIGFGIRYRIAKGNFIHSVVLIGDHASAGAIIDKIGHRQSGIHVCGVFPEKAVLPDLPALAGAGNSLLELFGREDIDSVIVATPTMTTGGMGALLQALRTHPVNIYATPESLHLPGISSTWLRRTGFPELSLVPLVNCPNNRAELLVKDVVDRLVALLILIIGAPVMLLCALGIALSDPGDVFFRQKRVGYKGREFLILKFRTMYAAPSPSTALTARNDPRIFPFGRFLRKTSLDECPQFFNVLLGDMSLVGPRPHMAEATAAGVLYFEAVGEYAARHRVKPGITGLAQVNGFRGPTETIDQIQSRVVHDLHYIENWSLVLDLIILCRTAFAMFGKNVF
jgi:exopolysaccharide biosynthesis polyprenyl glycosylphosphotransferase